MWVSENSFGFARRGRVKLQFRNLVAAPNKQASRIVGSES